MYIKEMQVETSVDLIDTTSAQVPDPNWLYTDALGHVHKYGPNFSTPTLASETMRYYEDGDPYYRLVCRKCGEPTIPGTLTSQYRSFTQGLKDATATITFCLTSDEETLVLRDLMQETGEVEIRRKELG